MRFCPDDGAPLSAGSRLKFIKARPTKQVGVILEGRYELRGLLGKGGMAKVYLAEDLRTRLPVAVKILHPGVAREPRERERFLREIEVAATIRHPHVVQVVDAGERPDGSPYIVLEFLHGESLGDLLRRDDSVEASFLLPLMADVASALAAAHAVGVVHRDIKPDNLYLLGERGAPYAIKVVDFGLAKVQQSSKLSTTGMAIGTLEYIAPEQALAEKVDARTDVYGLGVCMYRALTGRLPFQAPNDPLLVAQQLFLPPPRPSRVRPGLDLRIDDVILTAMRKRPENRYPTMAALLEDLERILGRREGPVMEGPMRVLPDLYEPISHSSREAAKMLRRLLPE